MVALVLFPFLFVSSLLFSLSLEKVFHSRQGLIDMIGQTGITLQSVLGLNPPSSFLKYVLCLCGVVPVFALPVHVDVRIIRLRPA